MFFNNVYLNKNVVKNTCSKYIKVLCMRRLIMRNTLSLRGWNDFFDRTEQDFAQNSLFDLFLKRANENIKIDVLEEPDKYVVKANLPGLEKENIKVLFDNGILSITAKKEQNIEKEKGEYLFHERSESYFSRSIPIDSEASEKEIQAQYKSGVLQITVPKVVTEKKESTGVVIE